MHTEGKTVFELPESNSARLPCPGQNEMRALDQVRVYSDRTLPHVL